MSTRTRQPTRIAGRLGRGRWLVLLGVLAVGSDIALGLRRVAACDSVRASRCLGGFDSHVPLVIGVAGIVVGWLLVVAEVGETQPLPHATAAFALVVVPVIAMVSDFFAEGLLNPSDGSWDGRPIPIRLAVLVVAPAVLTLATGALCRGRWLPVIGLTIASVAVSFVLPFVVAIAFVLVVSGGAGARVAVLICVAIVGGFLWRRRTAFYRRVCG